MNYRHIFHAGNFADCFKHALLVALVDALSRKPAPFCVLDTHAGAGGYDLGSEAALRTQEAAHGILRLMEADLTDAHLGAIARYVELVRNLGIYPGSPALIRHLLRPGDRLICCEMHPEEAAVLKHRFRRDPRVEVHARSAWDAVGSLLPPKERRGLVFIDPPFADRDEFVNLAQALKTGTKRFGHGIFAAWYPIKRLAAVHAFHGDLKTSGIRDVAAIEMLLRTPEQPDRLNGCGLLVINPPWHFEDEAVAVARAVLAGIGAFEPGAGVRCLRIANE